MKAKITKNDIRRQISDDVDQFLGQGGSVSAVDRGSSGLVNGYLNDRKTTFDQPKQERTPLNDVLNQLDAKKNQNKASAPTKSNSQPKKKVIYDDFGEPLRVVWE